MDVVLFLNRLDEFRVDASDIQVRAEARPAEALTAECPVRRAFVRQGESACDLQYHTTLGTMQPSTGHAYVNWRIRAAGQLHRVAGRYQMKQHLHWYTSEYQNIDGVMQQAAVLGCRWLRGSQRGWAQTSGATPLLRSLMPRAAASQMASHMVSHQS